MLHRAVRNNALWCHAVCASHGSPGEFHPTLWLARHGAPRYYPNAITLTPQIDRTEIPRTGGWAIKDSYQSLNLQDLGFAPLFDAAWIAMPPPQTTASSAVIIATEPDLSAWEQDWSAGQGGDPIFRPALLADPDIRFLRTATGGGILNRGADVVGVSNLFGDPATVWPALVQAAATIFPGLPLVAYDRGDDLAAALNLGFARIGPLRVWLRPSD